MEILEIVEIAEILEILKRVEIDTRNDIIPASVKLAQAHPHPKPPALTKRPSAGLGPVSVHPTHSGVGPVSC